MNIFHDKYGDTAPWVSWLFLFIFIAFIIAFIFFANNASAFWGRPEIDKKTDSYNSSVTALAQSEIRMRQDRRRLFSDHCDLIEYKINNEMEISDQRYILPCETGDQVKYYQIREGK